MDSVMNSNPNLPDGINFDDNDPNKMEGDDSQLVDEILTELNDGVEMPNQAPQLSNIDPQLTVDPHINMHVPDNNLTNLPVKQDIVYDPEESKFESLFNSIKRPLLIVCLAFIVFNPLFLSVLSTNLPRVFGVTDSISLKQVRTLLLATVMGVLYFASNLLM